MESIADRMWDDQQSSHRLLHEYKNLYWSPPMDVRKYGATFIRLCQELDFKMDNVQLLHFVESIGHPIIKRQLKLRRPETVKEAVDELCYLVYAYDSDFGTPEVWSRLRYTET